jgi:hypothetical protein
LFLFAFSVPLLNFEGKREGLKLKQNVRNFHLFFLLILSLTHLPSIFNYLSSILTGKGEGKRLTSLSLVASSMLKFQFLFFLSGFFCCTDLLFFSRLFSMFYFYSFINTKEKKFETLASEAHRNFG